MNPRRFKNMVVTILAAFLFYFCFVARRMSGTYVSEPILLPNEDGSVVGTRLDFHSDGTVFWTGTLGVVYRDTYDTRFGRIVVHENGGDERFHKEGNALIWDKNQERFVPE